jgi:hypothetical protein
MASFCRVSRVALALAFAALGAFAASGCNSCKATPAPAAQAQADAGIPVRAAALLTQFDALAPGAISGYGPRLLDRLAIAKPARHEVGVPLPAGLSLKVAWETRDDLVFARRYLTSYHVTVDALAPGTSCSVRHTEPAVPASVGASHDDESLRVSFSIDYTCTERKSASSLNVPIGVLREDGFSRLGAATGATLPEDAAAPAQPPPALTFVHFAPKSAELDSMAIAVLDDDIKVLAADQSLGLCLWYPQAGAFQIKRRAAILQYFGDHGIERPRLTELDGVNRPYPPPDDVELSAYDNGCVLAKKPQ